MWRHIASNVLTLFVVVLFLAAGVIAWGANQYSAEGPLSDAICLRVESGSNMSRVSRDLEEQGAISSGTIFRLGADYTEKTSQLKAGSFLVTPGASMEEIVDTVTRGGASTCGTEVVYRIGVLRTTVQVRELDPATNNYVERVVFNPAEDEVPQDYTEVKAESDVRFRISLAEGATSWQIVESLKQIDILEGDPGEVPPEGVLAPDSYEVTRGARRADLIAQMQAAQEQFLADAWAERDPSVPLESPEEALILASIVEKETSVPEERRQVASVFVNRLNQGMRLQTDPTVIYGITRGQGALGRGLRRSELQRETPWNTYVIPALPPTPIANPGRASIEAALNPDETPYIFFVADGTGGHAFAVTLDEHNRNVARWREIEAERANQ
ncbi:endolytic transglycosylase MltG [Cognatishimia sp. MH4019]|uniref:endolytic transglycosylase MltG n=1 Tax=Cognatishimia sp. MH4019 TaxID=2854030 RepID=UPI001CD7A157|nr:endolytic transglycosylase MltG [Cognatishimia sp. MH4019]